MAAPTDLSLMDILFDRDDPMFKLIDDKDIFQNEAFKAEKVCIYS